MTSSLNGDSATAYVSAAEADRRYCVRPENFAAHPADQHRGFLEREPEQVLADTRGGEQDARAVHFLRRGKPSICLR